MKGQQQINETGVIKQWREISWDNDHPQYFSNDLDVVDQCVDCGRTPAVASPTEQQRPWFNQQHSKEYEGMKIATIFFKRGMKPDGDFSVTSTAINKGQGKCRFCFFNRCQVVLKYGNEPCMREAKGRFNDSLMCGLHLGNHQREYEKIVSSNEEAKRRTQGNRDRLEKEIKAVEFIEKMIVGRVLPDSFKLKDFDEEQHAESLKTGIAYPSWDGENIQMSVLDFASLINGLAERLIEQQKMRGKENDNNNSRCKKS